MGVGGQLASWVRLARPGVQLEGLGRAGRALGSSGALWAFAIRGRDAYRFPPSLGAVAQLGERRVRNAEVGGSIPLGSTTFPSGVSAGEDADGLGATSDREQAPVLEGRGFRAGSVEGALIDGDLGV